MGSFYVGGYPKVTLYAHGAADPEYHQITIGQMYVQFMIPSGSKKWPLILVHGGAGYTGAQFESTDDGREGWMPYATRKGFSFYALDYAGRGRSGFDASVINEAKATGNLAMVPYISRSNSDDQTFGNLSFVTAYPFGFFGALIPAGSSILDGTLVPHGAPGDPQTGDHPPDFPLDVQDPAIVARAGAIGPAPNPVNNNFLALQHFKSEIPQAGSTLQGGETAATALDLAELIERMGGAVVAGHSGGGLIILQLARYMRDRGTLDKLKGFITLDAVCQPTLFGLTYQDFDRVPWLSVRSPYFMESILPYIAACPVTVNALNASPTRTAGPAAYIQLDDPSFHGVFLGVTHDMMLGSTSNQVFDVIGNWFDKNIPDSPRVSCTNGDEDGSNDGEGNGSNGQGNGS